MKKLLILFVGLTLSAGLIAQLRKFISQFSHLQAFYNPGLAGYQGTMLSGFVRNQWAGWEGAPKTYFGSAEFDFRQLTAKDSGNISGKNALEFSLLQDEYGEFSETELVMSYASKILIAKKANLRLGVGASYWTVHLDDNKLTPEQADDPIVGQYVGGVRPWK